MSSFLKGALAALLLTMLFHQSTVIVYGHAYPWAFWIVGLCTFAMAWHYARRHSNCVKPQDPPDC